MPVCTEGMCKNGRLAVTQMQQFYAQIVAQGWNQDVANLTTPSNPAVKTAADFVYKWSTTVGSVTSSLNSVDHWYQNFLPFDPGCCSVLRIGVTAQAATAAMAKDAGVPAPPAIIPAEAVADTEGTGSGDFIDKMEAAVVTGVKIVAIGGGVLVLLLVGSKVVKAWPKSEKKALPIRTTKQLSGRGRRR